MANSLDHLDGLSSNAIGKGKVGDPPPRPNRKGIKVKAAIFFDGTGNNQNNITKRLRDSTYMKPKSWQLWKSDSDYESYEQFYSNVATLYFMHDIKAGGEPIVSVYMEGIGTSNDGPDDTSGGGFGAGPTGIVARVNRGISDISTAVRKKVQKAGKGYFLEELTVYAFGFSRGAAAARHFCARRVLPRGGRNSLCRELDVKEEVVKLKFVGLYDTVSSYDPSGEKTPAEPSDTSYIAKAARHLPFRQGDAAFRDDVGELHLKLDDPTLERVVHLVAADEYRLNFSLTTIASALQQGKGYELKLPGAHSDIGGGYQQTVAEDRVYGWAFPLKVASFFKERGWYGPGQLVESVRYVGGSDHTPPVAVKVVVGRRPKVLSAYQYVGLSIMLKLAEKANSGLKFHSPNEGEQRGIKYLIPANSFLGQIKSQLEGYAVANFGASHTVVAPLPVAAYHTLRQHYLHLSWSDRLGFDMRFDTAGMPTRLPITG
jgi:hypothetical protein